MCTALSTWVSSLPSKRGLLAFTCLCLLFPAPSLARDIIAIKQQNGSETITLDPGNVSPNKVFTLDKPDRLVVDLPAFASAGLDLPSSYKDGLIRKMRTGRFNPKTTRIVFDLDEKITADRQEKNGRLVIAIAPADAKPAEKTEDNSGPSLGFLFSSSVEKPQTEPPKAGKDQIDPKDGKKESESKSAKSRKNDRSVKAEPKSEPEKTAEPERRKSAEKKPAKSGKPVVVIDPGHGGIDPGTAGDDGAVEKMIVLEYAQALRNRLQKSGHYQVVLTRDHDQFIMLRQRVAIARKAQGDIFISLHADSAPGEARGLSIYTVSEKASDEEAEKLAARENKADVLAGINLTNERPDVAGILISLAERDTKNRSATLADMLVTALDDKVHLLPDSHRFAGFAVLKAPDIPSVLIEIGFLSHPQEEKLIKSKAYRDKVVSGIAAGIDSYFKKERQPEE